MSELELNITIIRARRAYEIGQRLLYDQLRAKLARHYGVFWEGVIAARWPSPRPHPAGPGGGDSHGEFSTLDR